jgi:hypothetical protein
MLGTKIVIAFSVQSRMRSVFIPVALRFCCDPPMQLVSRHRLRRMSSDHNRISQIRPLGDLKFIDNSTAV